MERNGGSEDGEAAGTRKERIELPASNSDYSKREYWNTRFADEQEYDWLAGYKDIASILSELTPKGKDSRILLVGCGNSTLTKDMHDAGYRNLVSTDFSEVVIQAMQQRYGDLPGLRWEVMDMLNLQYPEGSFDMVLDKAAMDAITTAEGDMWDPDPAVIDAVHRMCTGVSRVLVPGGTFVQISFVQPHFRLPYLTGKRVGASVDYGWQCSKREIEGKVMPHFCYIMHKAEARTAAPAGGGT
ncbi:S-adenosyl-L-methionine-dependent methyltransferase [Tribonema minus]|uniref:S-adenosyl-L-methionine-dependent methyltransferase n=1 Tax=Tribonema minus TaxID=303371 RepID=A0A836CL89_9STRA|nr:S-adenosyl-L-methionine-dependent methyltransferase [Tribonema minus]